MSKPTGALSLFFNVNDFQVFSCVIFAVVSVSLCGIENRTICLFVMYRNVYRISLTTESLFCCFFVAMYRIEKNTICHA